MEPNKKNEEIIEGYDYLGNSASTQDCTGLIPTLPQDEAEREAYEEIYPYMPNAVASTKE